MKAFFAALIVPMFISFTAVRAADVFLRLRVVEPRSGRFTATISGWRHEDPWYLPTISVKPNADAWSDWVDLSKWPWHGRLNRAGGVAEWPAVRISVARGDAKDAIRGCAIEVQIADRADAAAVVHSFVERSASDTIAFLVPTPLREHAKEFETGSQMTARQLAWAKQAAGDHPPQLNDFTFITAFWGYYDPALAAQATDAMKLLGFNIIGQGDRNLLRQRHIKSYQTTWLYEPDPREVDKKWQVAAKQLSPAAREATHWVIGDEVTTLPLGGVKDVDLWFRAYLRDRHVQGLAAEIDQIKYPADAMAHKSLPRDADLPTRRLMYHAAKFGQWWSVKQLRHVSDLIHGSIAGAQTETLPSDHGFLNAWGPPHIGMSYRMLDLFELGAQRSVDQLSAEDWIGLNHMYGPAYTWTGAQTFEYFASICRSATLEAPQPMLLRSLLTVSDDDYLRLKAFSALGQGVKSFFFWTFGPTYIGTENYWSDLRSEYDGIAKLGRAIEKAEPVLYPAKPVRDPVAILYSVSHDIWHTDNPAAFAEKRLLWHALRHLHVQPDFLREEDVEADKLRDYKVLYVTDWCISRAASAKIEKWVKDGGVVYMSAGAATRDEFYEPYLPPFATEVWPADAALKLISEAHQYNERTDLPTIKPIKTGRVSVAGQTFELPVLGCALALKNGVAAPAQIAYGKGKIIAIDCLPMLAYGQGANFKPTTLQEHWPDGPRQLPKLALDAAGIKPLADCDVPVVETSLLTGDKGFALVLVNYTYKRLDTVTIELTLPHPIGRATSVEGASVKLETTPTGVRLRLPLKWTDIILLQ